MKAPVPGAAVICLHGDAVLLIQRANEPNRGRWSFPGGKIHPGEAARDAAAREALEETGVAVRVLDLVDVYDALFPPYHYTVADYLAEPLGELLSPRAGSDCLDARWVPLADVGEYELTAAMESVLRRALWLRDRAGVRPACLGETPREPVTPRSFPGGIYFVTPDVPPDVQVELVRAAVEGGVKLIQLRHKSADAGTLLPAARRMQEICRTSGALFLINDRIDLAVACRADGVHLGQTDLPVSVARDLLGPDAVLGVSVESSKQAATAQCDGANYLGVGPVYGSTTKLDAGPAVGLAHLAEIRAETTLPVVAIGGITLPALRDVRATGAHSAAVIGAIASAPDPAHAAGALVARWAK